MAGKLTFSAFKTSPRDALEAATRKMGMDSLKDMQKKAILAFVGGKDTFVSLSTGYGKSVIYGILPMMYDELLGELILSRHSWNVEILVSIEIEIEILVSI